MKLKLILSSVFAATSTFGICAPVDGASVSSPLPLSQTTKVPGETLKAGDYSITLVDQLADRMIVRIDSKNSTHHAIFLGVRGTVAGDRSGPILWTSGLQRTPALRGFNFPNGSQVEFVYPKAEAAALAQGNSAKVVAIDPQSEGRPALKNLSQEEMQIVNLWMLSLTTTGVDNKTPAVLAQRYEPRTDIQPVVAAVPPQPVSRLQPEAQPQIASAREPAISQPVAAASGGGTSRPMQRRAVIAQLPHTASYLPLVWLAAMMSFFGAGVLRGLRLVVLRRSVA